MGETTHLLWLLCTFGNRSRAITGRWESYVLRLGLQPDGQRLELVDPRRLGM